MTTDKQRDDKIKELEETNARLKSDLEHEHMMFRSVLEVFRDPKAGRLPKRSMRALVGFAEKLRQDLGTSLKTILSITNISKSTYEYNRKKLGEKKDDTSDIAFDETVRAAFEKSNGTFGYRRLRASMIQDGLIAPEGRVRDSMRRQHLIPSMSGYRLGADPITTEG